MDTQKNCIIDNAFVIELLNNWGVSAEIQNVFQEHDIDGFCLENMTESDIHTLIPVSNIKDRIKFRAGLKLYKDENKSLSTATFEDSDSERSAGTSETSEASCYEETNFNKKLKTSLDLKTILKSNNAGELCLASLKKNNKLDSSSRNYMVKSVVEYYVKEYGYMNKEHFENLASQIVSLVPTEVKETYYIPSQKFGKQKYIPARGKLVDRYNNHKRILRKSGLLKIKEKDEDSTVTEVQSVPDDETVTDEEFADLKLWLKFNKEPLNDILNNWKKTAKGRIEELKSEKFKNIQDILQEWPAYKLSIGYKLIELDFDASFPCGMELLKKWPTFMEKAQPHFTKIKAAEAYTKCLQENSSEDVRDFCYCSLIAYKIIPTTRVNLKTEGGSKNKSYKPSIKESLNSFILHVKNQSEVLTQLDNRRDVHLQKGLRCQPIIVVVGATIEDVSEFYVSYDNILYKLHSFLKALDVCFKTFHCLDAEYPIEAIHIWTFIQKYFYNIDLKSDKKLSGVSSFISDLK